MRRALWVLAVLGTWSVVTLSGDRPEGKSFATRSVVHARHEMVAAAHPIAVNLVDFGMNLQEAGDAPRFRHVGSQQPTGTKMTDGGRVLLESDIPREVRLELLRRGHRIEEAGGALFGGYEAVRRDPVTACYSVATESRKDGQAAGF